MRLKTLADNKKIISFIIIQYLALIIISGLLGVTLLGNRRVGDDGSYWRHTRAACFISSSISTIVPFTGEKITNEILSWHEDERIKMPIWIKNTTVGMFFILTTIVIISLNKLGINV